MTDMSQRRRSEEHTQNGNHITRTTCLSGLGIVNLDLGANNGTTSTVPSRLPSRKVMNRREYYAVYYCINIAHARENEAAALEYVSLKLLKTRRSNTLFAITDHD
jgi:hypothetical protein